MKAKRTGFTLVELSISMIFVGVLSLAIVFVINNTVIAYRRGNTLNQVNTVGMDLVDDMRMAVQSSSAKTLTDICAEIYNNATERTKCENDGAYNFISITKYAKVTLNEGTENEQVMPGLPIYGVFCTGTYSYIWNSGYFESNEATFTEKGQWAQLVYNGGAVREKFKLLKVMDESRSVCLATVYPGVKVATTDNLKYLNRSTNELFSNNVIDLTNLGDGTLREAPIYLMAAGGENNLAIYDLMVSRPAISTENNNGYYPVSFIIGTIDGGINILASGKSCAAPNDYDGNLDYCAINRFSFAARSTGE